MMMVMRCGANMVNVHRSREHIVGVSRRPTVSDHHWMRRRGIRILDIGWCGGVLCGSYTG